MANRIAYSLTMDVRIFERFANAIILGKKSVEDLRKSSNNHTDSKMSLSPK